MHSLDEMGPNVPAFLAKLWKMVEDPETNEFISWSASGTSFTIRNQARFSRELLPVYYKHNNMASFVRQLNMYGFHKVVSIEGGGLKIDKDEMEFAHSCFLMGHPYLLEHIKRKIPAKFEEGRTPHKSDLVNKVLSEVKTMKGRQDNVDSQLSAMKRENEVLWREVAILRQKHLKQQQIVNKLIQFLVSMVQSSRNGGLGIKRHYPLMLGDKAHVDAAHHDSTQHNNKKKINSNSHHSQDLHDVPNHPSPSGPVIHELEATDLPDDCIPECTEETVGSDFLSVDLGEVTQGEVHSPASSSSKGSAPLNLSEPNCDVLLELVEDYPLSPEILTTASPAEVNPCITSSKNKSKAVGSNNNCDRKKKTKRVRIKEEIMEPAEVNSLNVGDFLEIVLPNMEGADESTLDPTAETILPTEPMDTAELDPIHLMVGDNEQSTLDAATDAAISAISDVATETSTAAAVAALEEAAVAAAAAAAAAVPSGAEASRVAVGCKIPEESLEMQCVPQETVLPDDSETPSDSLPNMTLACTNNSPGANSIKSKEELNSYVGNIQSDLDSLKDLLKGEGYSLDANTLLGLFSEDPMAFGLHFVNEDGKAANCNQNKENNPTDPLVSGGELATYSSNLLDLVDLNAGLDDWSLPDTETLENYTNDIDTPQILLPESPEFPNPPSKKRRK